MSPALRWLSPPPGGWHLAILAIGGCHPPLGTSLTAIELIRDLRGEEGGGGLRRGQREGGGDTGEGDVVTSEKPCHGGGRRDMQGDRNNSQVGDAVSVRFPSAN